MAFKFSTGLRNSIIASTSVLGSLEGKVLKLFSGTEPATADASIGAAQHILTISQVSTPANGIHFEPVPVNGVLVKSLAETWNGIVLSSATATFFRLEEAGDVGGASTTAIRLQGSVGIIGADLTMDNPSLTVDEVQPLEYFALAFPA